CRLAAEGVRTVDVACPGFAVDCLETLEEIALQDAALFRAAALRQARGGRDPELRYIPCLNAGDALADAIAALARGETGWRRCARARVRRPWCEWGLRATAATGRARRAALGGGRMRPG